jgi:hypothetical protein
MKSWMAICLVTVNLCMICPAQNEQRSNEESGRILSLENAWNEAEARHDGHALRLLTTDTFRYTDAAGKFMNRSQWLSQIETETGEDEQLANSKMEVQVYLGNVAVVTGEYREKVKEKQKSSLLMGRFTDTWIQQNHEWRCVASQETLISH